MFCRNCGKEIPNDSKFCQGCGNPVSAPAQPQAQYQQPVYQQQGYAPNAEVRRGIPAPGYSDRVSHPEIIAAVKKNRKAAGIFAFFIVPLPFIGFVIYSLVSDEMETSDAMLYGAIVSGIFLFFALFSFIRERAANTYDAVVVDKKTVDTYRNDSDQRIPETEYITYIRRADGKKKKITEREGGRIIAYRYLNIGDNFRYHPQFNFPYELYDKSRAPYLGCVICGKENPVTEDRCRKCNAPLLK